MGRCLRIQVVRRRRFGWSRPTWHRCYIGPGRTTNDGKIRVVHVRVIACQSDRGSSLVQPRDTFELNICHTIHTLDTCHTVHTVHTIHTLHTALSDGLTVTKTKQSPAARGRRCVWRAAFQQERVPVRVRALDVSDAFLVFRSGRWGCPQWP